MNIEERLTTFLSSNEFDDSMRQQYAKGVGTLSEMGYQVFKLVVSGMIEEKVLDDLSK